MGEEKNRKCECQVCHRLYDRGEGVCECGADLATFGKWIEVDGPGPEPEPPRKIWKVVGLIALILLVAAGGVFAYIRMGPEKANEEAEERQEAQADDSGMETKEEVLEEETDDVILMRRGDMDEILHVFAEPESGGADNIDMLGWKSALVDGWLPAAHVKYFPEEADSYKVDVVTAGGAVYRFLGVPGKLEGCTLFLGMQDGKPVLTYQDEDQPENTIDIYGEEVNYEETYGSAKRNLLAFRNETIETLEEFFVYESGADSKGDNLIAVFFDSTWISNDRYLKVYVDTSRETNIELVDSGGRRWYYENVNLQGAVQVVIESDDDGYLQLLVERGGDDVQMVSGQLVEGE